MRNEVYCWAIVDKEGRYVHQIKEPDTVDVWLMQDWPDQIVTRNQGMRVVSGMANMEHAKRTRKRGATRPYTIPESDYKRG